jgi:hypothetical protein
MPGFLFGSYWLDLQKRIIRIIIRVSPVMVNRADEQSMTKLAKSPLNLKPLQKPNMIPTNRKKRPAGEEQKITRLIGDRRNLELHAAEVRNEIIHLKKALRITQNRIRRVNSEIDRVERGSPVLTLVVSNSEAT